MSQNCIPLNRQFLTPFNDWSFSPHQGIGCWVESFLNVVWFALLKGGGGGGGYQPEFLVKLVFEIAVDKQTRTSYQTFEGVQDPNHPSVPVVHPRPYWSLFCPIMSNYRNIPKTKMFGALLVASGLLNYYMKFHQNGQKMAE